jgi:hypothetical protein
MKIMTIGITDPVTNGACFIAAYRSFLRSTSFRWITLWRRHLIWAADDGGHAKALITQRLSTNTVFLSLLVASEIAMLFSPALPAHEVRRALKGEDYTTIHFWAGISLCTAIIFSVAALYTNFTAWSIISPISNENVHTILRSSLGLYSAIMPTRLVVLAIYMFFLTVVLFLYVIMHWHAAMVLTFVAAFLLLHVTSTFSALGRVILYTGAMGKNEILSTEEEERLAPYPLYLELLKIVQVAKRARVPVHRQYRISSNDEKITPDPSLRRRPPGETKEADMDDDIEIGSVHPTSSAVTDDKEHAK